MIKWIFFILSIILIESVYLDKEHIFILHHDIEDHLTKIAGQNWEKISGEDFEKALFQTFHDLTVRKYSNKLNRDDSLNEQIAKEFIKFQKKKEFTIKEVFNLVDDGIVTKFYNKWKNKMIEIMIREHKVEPNDEILAEIYDDPDFFGLNYNQYEQIRNALPENDSRLNIHIDELKSNLIDFGIIREYFI